MSRKTKHINWTEIQRLVKSMKKDNNRLHLLVTIQSLLGLRISDVLSLRWRDLLYNAELSIIEKKTGKERRMAISKSLQEAVIEEYNKYTYRNDSDYIFLNKFKTKPISVEYVNRQLKSAFEKYDIKAKQVSSHVLRKSWAYKILEDNNFSDRAIFTISRMMNHSNISTTMVYLNLHQREEDLIYKGLAI